jgi:hypothetical protein
MDVHKPKAAHSLREFLGELLSVTVGILIALSLEAMVEQWRTDRLIDYARDDFRTEIQDNRTKVTADLETSQASLTDLMNVIAQGRLLLAHQPAKLNAGVSRTFVLLESSAWTSALSTQVMGHFPHEQARAVAEVYSKQEEFAFAEHAAQQQWFVLAGFASDPKDLTETELREGLQQGAEAVSYLDTLQASEKRMLGTYDQALKALAR